jgi:hypothetical protein
MKPVTKEQFVEVLEFAHRIKQHSLIYSQDLDGNFWPIPEIGYSKKEDRQPIIDGPDLLIQIAQIHSEGCPEGGKFRITFCGGWSLAQMRWFVLWEKSKELARYEHSAPLKSMKYVDLYAMLAKHDPPAD